MSDAADVRRIALSLPDTTTTQDREGYLIRKKPFVWTYHERIEPKGRRVPRHDVLVVRVDGEGEKQFLLASDPAKFFTNPRYDGYPAILVRLSEVGVDELTELISDAWRGQAPKYLVKQFEAEQS